MATAALLLSTLIPPLQTHSATRCRLPTFQLRRRHRYLTPIRALQETEQKTNAAASSSSAAEEVAEKYGLEFGLWKVSKLNLFLFPEIQSP